METATGAPIVVPYWNDLSNNWVLNSANIAVTDPTISSGPTLTVSDYRFQPVLIDNSLIQDAAFDVEAQIVSDITTRYVRNFSNLLTNGGTGIQALTSVTSNVVTSANTAISYADVVSFATSLDPSYSAQAVFTFSTNTLGKVLQIVDGNQRPIFIPYTSAPTFQGVGSMLGFPVRINQYLASFAATKTVMQFGDFNVGYKFRTVTGGIRIKMLDQLYAATNQIAYVAFCRVAGAVVDPGSHPILSLVVKA
jgi:HK97 family phage major capsid protein